MAKKRQRYDEEYEYAETFTKFNRSKKKKKGKGHQSKYGLSESERWAALRNELEKEVEDTEEEEFETVVTPHYTTLRRRQSQDRSSARNPSNNTGNKPTTSSYVFGPNTHEIKGVKIDLDGVSEIEKVEAEHNGSMTFGIKFTFKGNKGFNRTVWYNRFKNDRDIAFEREYSFWLNLQHNDDRKNEV